MKSDRRRSRVCLPGQLWCLAAGIVLWLSGFAAAQPADDVVDEVVPVPAQQAVISDVTIYGWVFGAGSDAAAAQDQLDTLLRQKIAILDQVCGLSEIQKQKLRLAGRGDAQRLMDRVHSIGSQIRLAENDRDRVTELSQEAQSLQQNGVRPGLSADGSLFAKSLEQVLTAEQGGRYAPLRALVRAGGLVRIRRSGEAEVLEISFRRSAFTDDSLVHIPKLPGLRVLDLDKTPVTDVGLAQLSGMTRLEGLFLDQAHVTDAGLAQLNGLTGLNALVLDHTQVTDAGLVHLEGLTGLQHLTLKHTQITDAGLSHLKSLTKLVWLVLDETQVTDAGLAQLKTLSSLQTLLLSRTRVTRGGIADLKRALPRLAIHSDSQ